MFKVMASSETHRESCTLVLCTVTIQQLNINIETFHVTYLEQKKTNKKPLDKYKRLW